MHMADVLISPLVGGVMLAVAAGSIGFAAHKVKQNYREEAIPLMAVMGAFVFAAQMINFIIPGTGSSGHITGTILLAALLGPYAALLALSCVLILQALFFADGGLLALGCNVFNMAFMGCFVAYPFIFRPMLKSGYSKAKTIVAAMLTCVAAAQLGAFCVVLQTLASGVTELPFGVFVALIQSIHLAIGMVEGVLTALVLLVVWQAEPGLFNLHTGAQKVASGTLVVFLGVVTLVIGGGLSLLASGNPDGLEWSVERAADAPELKAGGQVYAAAADFQTQSALMPDYGLPAVENEAFGTSAAGIAGSVITVAVLFGLGLVLKRRRKNADVR